MTFLTPIWLFALAAIGIPVIIHLWNIRPGKTLKVGSIALFSQSSPKTSRNFKLMDILLLLLRCLLLILLAVLLAAPLWHQHLQNTKVKGWLLIPKQNFNEAYQHFKPAIDSLSKKGYEFHYFDKGFTKTDLNEVLQHPGKDTAARHTINYWDLVKQLARYAPPHVELFTPNTITHFTGDRPSTNLHANWHVFTPADSVEVFLTGAWLTPNGNIRVAQGTATSSGINYQYNDVKNGGQNGSLFQVAVENGAPVVNFKNTQINVDTTTQNISIYTDKNIIDANYLKAALAAASQFTQRKTIIKAYSQPGAIPAGQDWIFWLADKSAGNVSQKAKNLFIYGGGKVAETTSWMSNTVDYDIPQGQAKIQLYKTIVPAKIIGKSIWMDGFGRPVLSMENGQTNTYHFYNRFNPAFSDLVWSDEFPKWLLTITDPFQPKIRLSDRRSLSDEQLLPTHNENVITDNVNIRYTSITQYLWLALALLFFAERWLATRNKTTLANG